MALRLLQDRREHVARIRLVASRALHVHHGRGQDTAKGHRLLRLAFSPALVPLYRFVEVGRDGPPQRRQIGAARREDPFAFGVVEQRIEQVLEREVGMLARDGFAERHRENDFKRW